ncbi:MAG: hypothetical protein OXL41_00545 [Nitrospinae bacterium]|nr:hypothetical protein [Nitrospinota bacterium]
MAQPRRLEYRGFHQLELVRHGGGEIRIGGRLRRPPLRVNAVLIVIPAVVNSERGGFFQ